MQYVIGVRSMDNYYVSLGINIKGKKINNWRIGTRIREEYKHKWLYHNEIEVTNSLDDTVFYKLPIDNSTGKVLLSGLGLGILPNTLAKLDKIESILVVEKSSEVIAMIEPYILSDKITIINQDILEYIPEEEFDYAFIDIWSQDNKDNRAEEEKNILNNLEGKIIQIDFCQSYNEALKYYNGSD